MVVVSDKLTCGEFGLLSHQYQIGQGHRVEFSKMTVPFFPICMTNKATFFFLSFIPLFLLLFFSMCFICFSYLGFLIQAQSLHWPVPMNLKPADQSLFMCLLQMAQGIFTVRLSSMLVMVHCQALAKLTRTTRRGEPRLLRPPATRTTQRTSTSCFWLSLSTTSQGQSRAFH